MKPVPLPLIVLASLLIGSVPARATDPTELMLSAAEQEDYFEALFGVAAIGGDQFIAVGTRGSIDGLRCWVVRADASNRILWEKTPCSEPGIVLWSLTRLSNGDYVAVGYLQDQMDEHSDPFAIRFDGSGTVAWQRRYPNLRHERLYFVEELCDGSLLAGGRSAEGVSSKAPTDGLVLILSAEDGEQNKRFTFDSSDRERAAFLDGIQVGDGKLVLVGWATDRGTGNDDVWVLKAGLKGTRIWERRLGGIGDDLGHKAVAFPGSGVGIFGWGTPEGSDEAGGLFLELDRDGSLLTQREYSVGTGGNDRFRDAIAVDGDQFLVAGQASSSGAAPNQGWFLRLGPHGDLIHEDVLVDLTSGRFYGIALAVSGAVKAVGWSLPVAHRKADGWMVSLGAIPAQQPLREAGPNLVFDSVGAPGCGEIQVDETAVDCPFTLDAESRVWVSVLPLNADVDLVLNDAGGNTIDLSDNLGMAAEFIEQYLAPGDYVARISKFRECRDISRFRLRVTTPWGSSGTVESGGELGWLEVDRIMIERGLELVGYRPGRVDGFFSASSRRAIKALQAALEEEPTGFLTHGQRLHLAVFAALAAEDRALEVTKLTERLLPEAKLTRGSSTSVLGSSGRRVTKFFEGDHYGAFLSADDTVGYVGTWNDKFAPKGFGHAGVRGNGGRQWIGEFAEGSFRGYGVLLVDGIPHDVGEWGGNRTSAYGIKNEEACWVLRSAVSPFDRLVFKAHLFPDL